MRLLRTSAATAATITMTATPMAIYVVVGAALVGGWTASLGDGDCVVGVVGAGVAVGITV